MLCDKHQIIPTDEISMCELMNRFHSDLGYLPSAVVFKCESSSMCVDHLLEECVAESEV